MQIKNKQHSFSSQSDWQSPRKQTTNAAKDARKREVLYTVPIQLVGMDTIPTIMQINIAVPQKKLETGLPYDSATPLLGTYPKDWDMNVNGSL
jgi:hypothetical protein